MTAFLLAVASPAHADISTGLVGWWKFEDGSGVSAVDSSGSGNTGTLANGPTWTTGKVSKAVSFDGSNDYVSVPYTSKLAPASAVSFGAWFKVINKANSQVIISKTESGGYNIGLNNSSGACASSTSVCGLVNVGGTYYPVDYAVSNLSNDTWYRADVTYDNETVKLYLNAVIVASNTNPSGNISYTENNTLCVGSEASGVAPGTCVGALFNGSIDDVRIYNRALSAQDVADLYGPGILLRNAHIGSGKFNF